MKNHVLLVLVSVLGGFIMGAPLWISVGLTRGSPDSNKLTKPSLIFWECDGCPESDHAEQEWGKVLSKNKEKGYPFKTVRFSYACREEIACDLPSQDQPPDTNAPHISIVDYRPRWFTMSYNLWEMFLFNPPKCVERKDEKKKDEKKKVEYVL